MFKSVKKVLSKKYKRSTPSQSSNSIRITILDSFFNNTVYLQDYFYTLGNTTLLVYTSNKYDELLQDYQEKALNNDL